MVLTMHAAVNTLVQTQPVVIEEISKAVDRAEVLRYLGYPQHATPARPVEQMLKTWVDEAQHCAAPKATYLVLRVAAKNRRTLRLQTVQGVAKFKGAIGEFLGPSQLVAVFIATAGMAVEALAGELMRQGQHLPAAIVSAVGAERAEAAEGAVIDQLRSRAARFGFAPTLPYSPGYCGMKLNEQSKLFSLFGGATVGVTLTADCLMRPLKSVSGLIGLGPADQIVASGSPCERCELYSCAMRR